jgi:hypothetical protein
MSIFELQQEHANITKAFYEDKTLTKEDFERAHLINALRQCLLSEADAIRKAEAQARLDELLG